jgi:hypothetical protein
MINKKEFKAIVKQVIDNNVGNCSVCNQSIDTGMTSFSNMRDIKVSWGRDSLSLYIPKEITFTVPYIEIESYSVSPLKKQIDIELEGRVLVSIRGLQ